MTIKAAPPSVPCDERDPADNAQRFEHSMRRILSVSKDELTKREAAYQKSRRAKKARSAR